jgi:hypothetical protein
LQNQDGETKPIQKQPTLMHRHRTLVIVRFIRIAHARNAKQLHQETDVFRENAQQQASEHLKRRLASDCDAVVADEVVPTEFKSIRMDEN